MSRPQERISRERINRDLRSPLLMFAAIFFLGAAVFALPGVRQMFDLEATNEFLLYLSLDYIDGSAQKSWLFVKCLISVLALLVPLLTAVGLIILLSATFCRKEGAFPAWGMKFFSAAARVAHIILWATSVLLALLFVFRALRYIIVNGAQIGGVLFIFAMLLPELVFAAVVAIILYLTIRAMKSAMVTVDNIQLNILTGKCESYGLKSGPVWLVAMMGMAAIVLLIINRDEQAAIVCFALAALGDFLLAVWLLWYRKKNAQRALLKFRTNRDIFT